MRKKGRPKKQKSDKIIKVPGKRGRPRRKEIVENEPPFKKAKRGRPRTIKVEQDSSDAIDDPLNVTSTSQDGGGTPEENYSEGLHMSTMQVRALSTLVACLECGEEVVLGVRPTTKGMISEFTVSCKVCESQKSTNTPNLIRERKRKREKKGIVLQKNENINYAHVAAFLDNGLGYSGLRHYCKYLNARCLNEATFIVYAKQVISDVVAETEEFLQQNARIVRKAFESQLQSDYIIDLTVGYTTTYHQWGSDFCLVAGAVIELQTGLVLDYDVGNMYCHVCKINAKKIVSMSPAEMTEWFNKHQDTCEIREWCDEIDQDSEEGIKEIDPKYLEAFIAKKIWGRSLEKFGFRYTTLIHESDERIHAELLKGAPYGDIPVIIDNITNCFSRRKSEHARTSFQNKLKAKCPRERVQTKDRIMYVYSMSIPEYNKFAIGSNIKLRELVRRMEIEEEEYATELSIQASEALPSIREQELEEEQAAGKVGDAFEVEKEQDEEEEEEEEEEEDEEEDDEEQEDVQEGHELQEELMDCQDIEILEEEEEEGEEESAAVLSKVKVNKMDTLNEKSIAIKKENKTNATKADADSSNVAKSETITKQVSDKNKVSINTKAENSKILTNKREESINKDSSEEKSIPGTSSQHKKIVTTGKKQTVSNSQSKLIAGKSGNLTNKKTDLSVSATKDGAKSQSDTVNKLANEFESEEGNEEIKQEATGKGNKIKTVTENGTEESKNKVEVIRPFRVDFDDE